MRRAVIAGLFLFVSIATAAPVRAQTPDSTAPAPAPAVPRAQIETYAKAYVAVSAVRDSVHLQLAQARNKTADAQRALQEKLRTQIAEALKQHELTEAEYRRLTFVISSDPPSRRIFDEIIAELTNKT